MNAPWKPRCALAGVAVAVLSATCFAAVGDLEYAKSPPPFGRGVYVPFSPPKKLEQADTLKQLGAAEAFVVEGAARGIKVCAVVIRTKADTEDWDTIRVDLTGKGDFGNALEMAMKTDRKTSTFYEASIGPGQATVNNDGKDIPVTVTGYYYVLQGRHEIGLTLAAAAEGTCAFGNQIRKVRILDVTGDLRFGTGPASPSESESELDEVRTDALLDPVGQVTSLARTPPVPPGLRGADRVQVADGQGRFDDVKISGGTLLGSPVQVGHKWFLVRVDGMKASAEPLDAPTGKIAGNAGNWQLRLRGEKYEIFVNGAAKAVPVPADTYRVTRCTCFRPDKRGKAVPAVSSYTYPNPSLKIAEGETATIEMGLPVKATMVAKATAGKVTFSVKRVDAVGRRILRVMNAAGRRPEAPAIDVVDKTGNVVYTAKLEYG